MKYGFLVICLTIAAILPGCKKPIDLSEIATQVESITVYDLEGLQGLKYSEADLAIAFQESFDVALFREIAPHAKFKDKWVLWKGSRLAILKLRDGSEKRLALSYYGGFFTLLPQDGFYYFEGEPRRKFEREFLKRIVQENFIPKRIERNKKSEGMPQQTDSADKR